MTFRKNEEFKYIPQYARYTHRISNPPKHEFQRRIVVISDSHISPSPNKHFNKKMWDKAIDEILKIKNVDYYIHLGDLVHDGTFREYQVALDLLEPLLEKDFYIVPGNHDSRNVGFRLFEDYFGKRSFQIEDEDLYILGVDSSEPDQDWGVLGKTGIDKSQERFLDRQDKTKIFCFHHHLLPIPNTGRKRAAVRDGGDVLGMLLENNVDLVLNGHHHISNFYTCTDGDCDLAIYNAGTISCNKTRYNELFSYNIMDISDKVVKIDMRSHYTNSNRIRGRFINQKFMENHTDLKHPFMTLVHMGNTHFAEGHFNQFMYYQAMAQINELDPNLVVHTGSLTYKNNLDEYQLAAKFLKKLNPKLIVIPGFRDLRKYGWKLFPKMFGQLEENYEQDHLRIMNINTVDPNIQHGKIGRNKMKNIAKYFSNRSHDKFNIIAMNSRLVPCPHLKYDKILTDSGNVLDSFTIPKHNIDLILTGKNNVGYAIQVEDTILSMCGSLCSNHSVDLESYTYNIINFYENGLVRVLEHDVKENKNKVLGSFWTRYST